MISFSFSIVIIIIIFIIIISILFTISINPFAIGNFAETRLLMLAKPFSVKTKGNPSA